LCAMLTRLAHMVSTDVLFGGGANAKFEGRGVARQTGTKNSDGARRFSTRGVDRGRRASYRGIRVSMVASQASMAAAP
jgi:hypothetical protein